MDKAGRKLLRAKEIYERLAAENSSAYQPDLADTCYSLGSLYVKTNRLKLAKQEYFQVKEIYEQLAKILPEQYTLILQMVCEILDLLSEI